MATKNARKKALKRLMTQPHSPHHIQSIWKKLDGTVQHFCECGLQDPVRDNYRLAEMDYLRHLVLNCTFHDPVPRVAEPEPLAE